MLIPISWFYFQLIAFKHFKTSLSDLALSNLASIERRPDLLKYFKQLDDADLVKLCDHLGMRSNVLIEFKGIDKREVLLEALTQMFEKRTSQIEAINAMPLYPDEVRSFISLCMLDEYDNLTIY